MKIRLFVIVIFLILFYRSDANYTKYGAACKIHDDCEDPAYLHCRPSGRNSPGTCECNNGLVFAPIAVGKNKGVMWCLRKKGRDCAPRETANEDCITGFCYKAGKLRKCEESPNSSKLIRSLPILYFWIILCHL